MEHVISEGGLELAGVLADLNRRAAITGYGHIFPAEAPPPTIDELLALWEHWLGPDREVGRRAFVATADEEVVGVVLAGPDPAQLELGHLARLYVTPPQWGRGIGRDLYRSAMDHMRAAGFVTATLWVLERNDKARGWYERLGWRPSGVTKPVYAPAGIVDLQYRLDRI